MSKYKFEDIAFNSTAKKKPVEEDKYTYLGLEHLDSECLKVKRFGSEVAPIGDKLLMKKGDVLFGKRRAYQKKVAIAPFDGIFSAHGMVLRPKENVIDPAFFPLFISSDYFLDAAINISVGSLSPTINWKDLRQLEFELPDLDTQRKLAKILWSVQDTIESYKDLLSKTDELVKSQFIELINVKGGTISGKLGDYLQFMEKSKIKAGEGLGKGSYPLFNSSTELTKWYNDYLFDDECIILPTGGKAAVHYFKGKFASTTDNFVCKGNGKILTKYIYLFLKNNIDILQNGFKGSGLQHISKEYIKEMQIIAPELKDQRTIIKFADQSDKSKFYCYKTKNYIDGGLKYVNI